MAKKLRPLLPTPPLPAYLLPADNAELEIEAEIEAESPSRAKLPRPSGPRSQLQRAYAPATPARRSSPTGRAPFNAPRDARSGTGKQKRSVVSNTGQSRRRSSRGAKVRINIPRGYTGTGEQGH